MSADNLVSISMASIVCDTVSFAINEKTQTLLRLNFHCILNHTWISNWKDEEWNEKWKKKQQYIVSFVPFFIWILVFLVSQLFAFGSSFEQTSLVVGRAHRTWREREKERERVRGWVTCASYACIRIHLYNGATAKPVATVPGNEHFNEIPFRIFHTDEKQSESSSFVRICVRM